MKTLRRLCAMFVLALALAISAFAGQMSTTVVSPPPPDATATGQIETTATGDITTGVTGDIQIGVTGDMSTTAAGQMSTGATEVVLNLLQSVLSFF